MRSIGQQGHVEYNRTRLRKHPEFGYITPLETRARLRQDFTPAAQAHAVQDQGGTSSRVKGSAITRPRDLPIGERGLELVWRKRRWYCREPLCAAKSFTEQVRQVPARARITRRLRDAAGQRVCDAGSTVIQAARDLHLSWPTMMEAFRTVGTEVMTAALEPVAVLGIDETRRGRTQWRQNPDTGRWEPVANQWHTGFVDAFGVQGLLGQVEGRAPSDVLAWLNTTPLQWRKQIRYVAIDMSTSYRAAVRTGLPHATVVVDHFHVVQLANKMLNTVRRRTTASLRGRRGTATDPEWKARRRLLRNREDLTDQQFAAMWNALIDAGTIGMTLLTAWIAKERLRNLLATARTGADFHRIGHLRWKFLTWCADSGIPEVRQLATTVDRWWPEIAAFIATGHSNAKSEGVNRVIKLVARAAHGFRNPANQRLRTRCATTRRARGHLNPTLNPQGSEQTGDRILR
ncbi:ISL3 family transposase [Streptacidiphilus albus]|uniref:ISL3 family transposase n=2 Tax=Streptacidiphilus albus TaxID=105425 RepID=UPI0018CD43B9|nr:ISL3 family transposase [Streptacidiphilus albus]